MKTAGRFPILLLTLALVIVGGLPPLRTYAAANINASFNGGTDIFYDFGAVATNYAQPAPQTVTVTNTGTETITITQPTATNYIVGNLSQFTLNAGQTATFTVQPHASLGVRNWDEVIVINGNNGATANVTAKFTVLPDLALGVDPSRVVFGKVAPEYKPPAALSVQIENTGTMDIQLNLPTSEKYLITGTEVTVSPGQSAEFAIQPNEGLGIGNHDEYIRFVGDPGGGVTVLARFTVAEVHTITATAGSGGNIVPSGEVDVFQDEDQVFTITADAGYAISDIKVNGQSVGAVSGYTFENITDDHTIHAEFVYTGTGGTTGNTGSTTTSRSSSGSSGGTTATPSTAKSSNEARHLGGYSWRVDLPVLGFVEASVDGGTLTRGEDYTVRSGSTILTLADSYVNSLRPGSHTLRMEFLSATATIDFTVTPTGSGGGDVGESNAPAQTSVGNDNMNPSTGGVEATGGIAVLLAVLGLWTARPRKIGR